MIISSLKITILTYKCYFGNKKNILNVLDENNCGLAEKSALIKALFNSLQLVGILLSNARHLHTIANLYER